MCAGRKSTQRRGCDCGGRSCFCGLPLLCTVRKRSWFCKLPVQAQCCALRSAGLLACAREVPYDHVTFFFKQKSCIISISRRVEAVRSNFSAVLNKLVREILRSEQGWVKREGKEEEGSVCVYVIGFVGSSSWVKKLKSFRLSEGKSLSPWGEEPHKEWTHQQGKKR